MIKDDIKFMGIERVGSDLKPVARFIGFGENYVADKETLLVRLNNLKKDGIEPVETEKAIHEIEDFVE